MIRSKISWTVLIGAFLAGCGGGGAGLAGYYYPAKAVDSTERFEPGAAAFHDIVLDAKNPHGVTLTYAIVTLPTIVTPLGEDPGTLSNHLDGDEDVRYVPGTAPTGAYVAYFTFTVADDRMTAAGTTSNEAMVTIYVNTQPVANDVSVVVNMDTTDNVITLNGTDGDGHPLTYQIDTQPSNGTIGSDDGDNSVTYTPNGGYSGPDSFTYTVNDGLEDSDPGTVTIRVNDPPNAQDQTVVMGLGAPPVNFTLDASDSDGTVATYVLEGGPITGLTDVPASPVWSFDNVTAGGVWSQTFDYHVVDDDGALSATATVTLVVTSVWTAGNNDYGQLGNNAHGDLCDEGLVTDADSDAATDLELNEYSPVQVVLSDGTTPLTGIKAVAAGQWFCLALMYDGTVWAWGLGDYYGALGDGNAQNRVWVDDLIHSLPYVTEPYYSHYAVQVSGLTNVVAIYAGWYHSFAIKADGTVWAWGNNGHGELGVGDMDDEAHIVPEKVWADDTGLVFLDNVIDIAAAKRHSLFVRNDYTVWACGGNRYGELGDGNGDDTNNFDQDTIVQTLGGESGDPYLSGVAVGAGERSSLAVTPDGDVLGWGNNWAGTLGNGIDDGNSDLPHPLPMMVLKGTQPASGLYLENIAAVAMGFSHSLALETDKLTMWAWGQNYSGQLGDTSPPGPRTFEPVGVDLSVLSPGETLVKIETGNRWSLAISSDKKLYAWGPNFEGYQANDDTHRPGWDVELPTEPLVAGALAGKEILDVAGGGYHSVIVVVGQ